MPGERATVDGLPHPERLPLGAAFSGHCTAANVAPSAAMLPGCNLGYADCEHLPLDRVADAVRLTVRRDAQGLLSIQHLSESAHAPVTYGVLVFDPASSQWRDRHDDPCLQRMAECCVDSFQKRS